MKLDKIKKTYNDYELELSWGQLEAIRELLEQNHDSPVVDELLAEWTYYMNNVPGPGEDEEDIKAREEGKAPQKDTEEEGELSIPEPPTEDKGAEPPESEEEITPESMEAALDGDGPVPEPGFKEEVEEKLPAPPAE